MHRPILNRRTLPRRWVLLGCLLTGAAWGQRPNGLGNLENLHTDSALHRAYYEQRVFRNPLRGLLDVRQTLGAAQTTELVPLHQGVPIAAYRLGTDLEARPLSRDERRAYARRHAFESRRYKFDLRIHPEFIAQFGYRENPVESKFNLLLQTQLYLARGLVLNGGVLLPVQNDFDNQPRNVRPAPVYLNQFLALDGSNFISLAAGLFYNDRYGLHAQYRNADPTSRWSAGLEAGLTGFQYFPPSGFYYEPLRDLLLLADVAWRIPTRDVTLKLMGGQFLYQDRGLRAEFIRQFPDVEVGLYVMKTGNGSTGGFNFAIPIPPGRLLQSRKARLRTSEEFRWEYSYSRGYRIGTRYRVGTPLDALLRQYHRDYLRNQYRMR